MKHLVRSLIFSAIFLCATLTFGQTAVGYGWHTIVSEKGEFSVALPASYIVHNDDARNRVLLAGGSQSAGFEVIFRKTSSGREMMRNMHSSSITKGEHADSRIGDSQMHLFTFKGSNGVRRFLAIATESGFYSVSLSEESDTGSRVANLILASIQVEGKPLMNTSTLTAPVTTETLNVGSLKSSDVVLDALRRKQTEKIVVDKTPPTETLEEKELTYTRPVMVLEFPHARYSSDARSSNIAGIIRVRILFKANGQIGKVTFVKNLGHGLDREVIAAVKGIKFLPAELNGQRVDAEKELEYTFSIY